MPGNADKIYYVVSGRDYGTDIFILEVMKITKTLDTTIWHIIELYIKMIFSAFRSDFVSIVIYLYVNGREQDYL